VLLAQEGSVLLSVLGPNQEPINNSAKDSSFFQEKLPLTGRYTIQVRPVPGQSQSNYNLSLGLENPVKPTPTPTEILPSPTPTPTEILPSPTPTPTEILPSPTPTPTETLPLPTPTEQPSIVPFNDQQNNPPASETPNSVPSQTDSPPRL
ncbi:MAG: hypothetical protein ACRDEA_15275, partial [Microcystaceae cyanobacterium]